MFRKTVQPRLKTATSKDLVRPTGMIAFIIDQRLPT
jgi:hypothetical protein